VRNAKLDVGLSEDEKIVESGIENELPSNRSNDSALRWASGAGRRERTHGF
jgi:hypothetical protein